MKKGEKIYEGKAKILYSTEETDKLIQHFKDDATAFNAQKKGTIKEKGVLNNKISSRIFELLEKEGVKTHFIERTSDRDMLVKKVEIIPVEIVIRNVTAGSLSKRMGIDEGITLKEPILEFYYKSDELGDPMINEYHIKVFNLANEKEMDIIKVMALKVNKFLVDFFDKNGIRLIDFKLEFGRYNGDVLLADEITPDGCRLWDKKSGEKMDKDRFRQDLGKIEEAYQEVYKRVFGN
ncbi:MAG: phosphoribosylaminoimidazolesuccinocarboxamide synthase [Nitrospinae bacterium RIFCSPLOWO2_01_FULL_39_10]|nr:MAG: phosphoribosylaminoimidazolesuccinocarboxamide synthase [Nitrospinae bacterium RIFCSPLOWO2_01_FULL_39_10]